MRALPLVALALVLAGCAAEAPAPATDDAAREAGGEATLVAHRAGARVAVPSSWDALRLDVLDTGLQGFEPTLGVTRDGAIFVTVTDEKGGRGDVARSRDGGTTWERVGDPLRGPRDFDPWLHVDPATDRVFSAPLHVACAWLSWSDDGGASWDRNPLGGCGLPLFHFQKLTTGPPPSGVRTEGYASVVYVSSTSLRAIDPARPQDHLVGGTGSWIARSLDGGRTFGPSVEAHPLTPDCYSQAGPVAVARDGAAYSAQQTCEGVRVARSLDAGASWELVALLDDVGYLDYGSAPRLAADAEGNLYLAYPAADGSPVLRTSVDGGRAWSAPKRVAPPEQRASVWPALAVGAPGRVAVAYAATEADPASWPSPNPTFAPRDAVWHFHVAYAEDALAPEPTFVVARLTSDEDPLQVGCIWMGGDDNTRGCRNQGDFVGIVEHEGRARVAYVDGCDACSSEATSRQRALVVAVQREGPSLHK